MEIKDVFGDFPTLETSRLILRKFKLTDVDDLFEYASNKNIDKYVPWYAYNDRNEAVEFINSRIERYNEGNLSYIYTQNSDAVDDAQQKYEDALYAMQNLSSEYIDEMSE